MYHGQVSPQIAAGLSALRSRIDRAKLPSSKLDESFTIATWNIREFGKRPRSEAAIHYIAEILGQFDLVGIVELRDDLADLRRVLSVLGPYWHAVYSDAMPDPGGNHERLGFVYDSRAVIFTGLAAEAQAPRTAQGDEYLPKVSWWRSPYMASFSAGSFDFVVLTAHVRWGSSASSRKGELQLLADWIDAKRREKNCEDRDILVMGDFNIPKEDDELFKAITSRGLEIPTALRGLAAGTNLERNKRYDQILHYPIYKKSFTGHGGALDFYDDDIGPLFPGMGKREFTFELSDHLPLWMQVRTDVGSQLLDEVLKGPGAPAQVRRPLVGV